MKKGACLLFLVFFASIMFGINISYAQFVIELSHENDFDVLLNHPKISKIEVVNKYPKNLDLKFHSDVKIKKAFKNKDGDIILTVIGKTGFAVGFGDSMSPVVGLPNTRMDISSLKPDGLYYAGYIWFPTDDKESYIICTEEKIIGVNVKKAKKN